MRNYWQLLKAESLKVFGDIKNYWLNYVLGNLNVFFMFLGMFYAFSKNSQDGLGKLTFLFGLMFWYFGVHAVDLIGMLIEEEIEQGTLEQLLMSRTTLSVSLFFRIIAQILFDLFKGVFVFAVCAWAFGIGIFEIFSFRFLAATIAFFIGLLAMYGFGYMVAGLSLVYKQASSVVSISSTLILFFSGTTIDIGVFPRIIRGIVKLFPFYWSNTLIEGILRWDFTGMAVSAAVLLTELAVWISCGILVLNYCIGVIYDKGTTGNY